MKKALVFALFLPIAAVAGGRIFEYHFDGNFAWLTYDSDPSRLYEVQTNANAATLCAIQVGAGGGT